MRSMVTHKLRTLSACAKGGVYPVKKGVHVLSTQGDERAPMEGARTLGWFLLSADLAPRLRRELLARRRCQGG